MTKKASGQKRKERYNDMLNSEKKKLITENEIKPNRYAANTLIGFAAVLLLVFVLNEMNIYHVNKDTMRLCCFISFILLLIPQIIVHNSKLISHPASKYVIMTVIMLLTLIMTTLLNIYVTLVLILPMLLASQYRSYYISFMAFFSSCICCVLSPILAYFMRTWSLNYLSGYIETLCSVKIFVIPVVPESMSIVLGKILLYLILPQLLILFAFGVIMFSVTKKGMENLRDQIKIIQMGEVDSLTGLLNRNSYENNLSTYSEDCKFSIACIYADVNGLHELNNRLGHEAGDKMLKSVAEVFKEQFGTESTFRIGGDEFLVFIKDIELPEVENQVSKMKEAIIQQGYHISIGVSIMSASDNISDLVKTAEQRMYEDKRRFYEIEGNDRRKRKR